VVKRDTDLEGWWEVHPQRISDVRRLGTP
jgi:hypothetical protein